MRAPLAIALLVALVGCSVTDQVESPEPIVPPLAMHPLTCQVNVAGGTMACTAPAGVAGKEVLGKQGIDVLLASSNIQVAGGIFSADVTVKNLNDVDLGINDAGAVTGLYVFFVSGPTVTAGSGNVAVVNQDITALFTATGQKAFHYNALLGPREVSAPKNWHWSFDPGVTDFTFTVLVAADVPQISLPLHWNSLSGNFTRGTAHSLIAAINSPTSALILYDNGTYLHRNASGWDRFPIPPGITISFSPGPAFSSETSLSAAGGDIFYLLTIGTVYRIEGSHWTEFNPRGLYISAFDAGVDGTVAMLGNDPTDGDLVTAFDGTTWHDLPVTGGLQGTVLVWKRTDAVAVDFHGNVYRWNGGNWLSSLTMFPTGIARLWDYDPQDGYFFFGSRNYFDGVTGILDCGITTAFRPTLAEEYIPINWVGCGPPVGLDPGASTFFLWNGGSDTEIRDIATGALTGSTGAGFPWMSDRFYDNATGDESWLVGLENGSSATYRTGEPLEPVETPFDLTSLGRSIIGGEALGGKFYGVTQSNGPGGGGDVIIAGGGTTTFEPISSHRIYGIHPRSPTDIVVAGEDGLISYNGTGWTLLDSLVYGAHFRAIWAHGDTTFAWRDTTLMRRIGGGTWGVASSEGWALPNKLGGSSGYDVYLGSADYQLLRFTGTSMFSLILPTTPNPELQHVTAVSSRDQNDLWVGLGGSPNGANVRLAHWDGSGWTWWLQSELPLTGIGGIVTQENGRALIGDAQGVFLFDASNHSYRRVVPASAGVNAGRGLYAEGAGDFWALGTDGSIYHGTR